MSKPLNSTVKKTKLHLIHARFPDPVYKKLISISLENDRTISSMLRFIVAQYLANHRS